MRSFRRILCLIGGIWHHQIENKRIGVVSKQCSSKQGQGNSISTKLKTMQFGLKGFDFGSVQNSVVQNRREKSDFGSVRNGVVWNRWPGTVGFGIGIRIGAEAVFGGSVVACGLGMRGSPFFFYGILHPGWAHACHRDQGAGWADLPASAGRQLIDLHTGDFLRVTRVGRHGGKSPLHF